MVIGYGEFYIFQVNVFITKVSKVIVVVFSGVFKGNIYLIPLVIQLDHVPGMFVIVDVSDLQPYGFAITQKCVCIAGTLHLPVFDQTIC